MEKNNNIVFNKLTSFSDDDLVVAYEQVCANHGIGLLPNNDIFIELIRTIQLEEASSSAIHRPLEDVIKDAEKALLLEIGQRFCSRINYCKEHAKLSDVFPIWRIASDNQVEMCRLLSFCVGFKDGSYDELTSEAFRNVYFFNEEQAQNVSFQYQEK